MQIQSNRVSTIHYKLVPDKGQDNHKVAFTLADGTELLFHVSPTPFGPAKLYLDPGQIDAIDDLKRRRNQSLQSVVAKEKVIVWPNNSGLTFKSLSDEWKTAIDQFVFMTAARTSWQTGKFLRLVLGFLDEDIVQPTLSHGIIRSGYRFRSPIQSIRTAGVWTPTP